MCIQNSARSQIAEGMARHFLGHQADVSSAGSDPAIRIHPMAVAVMAEIGIDISQQKPKSITGFKLHEFNLIVNLGTDEEAAEVFENAAPLPSKVKKQSWGISDPADFDVSDDLLIKKFRKIRDDIRKKVLTLRAAEEVW